MHLSRWADFIAISQRCSGEIDHLPYPGHFAEEAKCLFGPEILESFHDVVGDKWNRRTSADKLMITGNPEGEVELETRAYGQFIKNEGAQPSIPYAQQVDAAQPA